MTSIAAVFRYLWEHRSWSLPVAALALGALLHAHFHTCPSCAPAIAKVEEDRKAKDTTTQRDTTKQEGPRHVVKLNLKRVPANPPDERGAPADLCRPVVVPGLGAVMVPPGEWLESVTIEDEGPSKSETKVATDAHAVEDKKLSLTVTPQTVSLPRLLITWEPEIRPQVAFGVIGANLRLTERFWAAGSVEPFAKTPDGKNAVTWRVGAGWSF